MIPQPFSYHRPASIDDAVSLLAKEGEDAFVLAGGHSLIPMMKLRLAAPSHLIDLGNIAELTNISVDGNTVTIGAMATQADLIASEALADAAPIIRETALQIADPQVRNMGTLGGNVANGDPGNDMPAVMLALDASYTLVGSGGSSRTVAAREFYSGPFMTARESGEILTHISFASSAGLGYSYQKQKRKIGDYATAACAALVKVKDGTCEQAVIALTNVAPIPVLAEKAASALVGKKTDDSDAIAAAAEQAVAATDPTTDDRGPAEFRKHVAGIMVRRALAQAVSRAN